MYGAFDLCDRIVCFLTQCILSALLRIFSSYLVWLYFHITLSPSTFFPAVSLSCIGQEAIKHLLPYCFLTFYLRWEIENFFLFKFTDSVTFFFQCTGTGSSVSILSLSTIGLLLLINFYISFLSNLQAAGSHLPVRMFCATHVRGDDTDTYFFWVWLGF